MAPPGVDTPGEHLWNFSRLKQDASAAAVVALAFYAPFGFVLMVWRFFMLLLIMIFYPLVHMIDGCLAHKLDVSHVYARVSLGILGIFPKVSGDEHLHGSSAPIVAANHVSDFDACAIWVSLTPAEQQLIVNEHWRSVITFVQRLGWPMNPIYVSSADTKDKLRESVNKVDSTNPRRLIMFPEGRTSSGITVMPFFDFVFSLGRPVVPLAIRCRNPWPMQMQCNGCSVLHNVAALYFLPFTVYELTYLPEVKGDDLSKEAFAELVRGRIQQKLGVQLTTLSAKDKVAFGKARAEARKAAHAEHKKAS